MSEGTQNLQQQTQDQYLQQAQDYFGQSMGRIKGQMQSDSAQLESIMQQLPEESQAQIQEMTDSYAQFEGIIDQSAQDAGVQDTVDEAAQQVRQSADGALGQEPADQAAGQVQEAVGGVADQAQEAVGGVADQAEETVVDASQLAENLPPGYEAIGEPTTDVEGTTVQLARDAQGNAVDYTFDPQGNLVTWVEVTGEPVDEASQMAESLPEGYEVMGEPGREHRDRPARPRRGGEHRGLRLRPAGQPAGRAHSGESPPSWAHVLDHDPTLLGGGQLRRLFVVRH